MVANQLPPDLAAALRSLNTKAVRRTMARGDRLKLKSKLQTAIGRIGATAPTSAWAEWIAAGGNAVNWPIAGMVMNRAGITYLGRTSGRYTPAMCANLEDQLDLMSPKRADRYRHPSSCGCVVGINDIRDRSRKENCE
jgi:hypothetical protein